MVTVEKDLVIQNGRILGRLERWDIPGVLDRRCHKVNQLVPVLNWEAHQHACHQVGWGRYHCPIAKFKAPATRRRRSGMTNRELANEIAKLLE